MFVQIEFYPRLATKHLPLLKAQQTIEQIYKRNDLKASIWLIFYTLAVEATGCLFIQQSLFTSHGQSQPDLQVPLLRLLLYLSRVLLLKAVASYLHYPFVCARGARSNYLFE